MRRNQKKKKEKITKENKQTNSEIECTQVRGGFLGLGAGEYVQKPHKKNWGAKIEPAGCRQKLYFSGLWEYKITRVIISMVYINLNIILYSNIYRFFKDMLRWRVTCGFSTNTTKSTLPHGLLVCRSAIHSSFFLLPPFFLSFLPHLISLSFFCCFLFDFFVFDF